MFSEVPASPLLAQLQSADKRALRSDVFAGITSALLLLPQGLAYASLAGLPPIVGLYAALLPPLGYALLGTSRELSVGPVAIDSLLVYTSISAVASVGSDEYTTLAALLALMVGLLQLALGALRFGFLVNLLSLPVLSGFTSAAALVIVTSQLASASHLGAPKTLWRSPFGEVGIDPKVALLLGATVVALAVAKWKAKRLPAAFILMALATAVTYLLDTLTLDTSYLAPLGRISLGWPAFRVPGAPWAMVVKLLPSAVMLALVSYLEAISVGESFARKGRYQIDHNREFIALGASNFLAGVFQAFPIAGGLSRSSVNREAGAKSALSTVVASFFVGASTLLIAPTLQFIPKVVLSGLILFSALTLIEFGEARRLYKVSRADFTTLVATFASTLVFGVLTGIATGVLLSLTLFLRRTIQPHFAVLGRIRGTQEYRNIARNEGLETFPGVVIGRMDEQFYFGNVLFLRRTLEGLVRSSKEEVRVIILDCSAINSLDASAESALETLIADFRERGISLHLAHLKGPVLDVLKCANFQIREQENVFPTVDEAVRAATRVLVSHGEPGATSLGGSYSI